MDAPVNERSLTAHLARAAASNARPGREAARNAADGQRCTSSLMSGQQCSRNAPKGEALCAGHVAMSGTGPSPNGRRQ